MVNSTIPAGTCWSFTSRRSRSNPSVVTDTSAGLSAATVSHANWDTFNTATWPEGVWQATLYSDRLAYKTSGGTLNSAYLGNNVNNPAGPANPTGFYHSFPATGLSGIPLTS